MTDKLPGDYIAGFVDGEGCFYLTYRSEVKYSRPGQPKYYKWISYFAICLREDDHDILEQVGRVLGCGKIYKSKTTGQVTFSIQNVDDLYYKVIPFFKINPLRAKKRFDFDLWCRAVEIMYANKKTNKRLTEQDNRVLFEIRQSMRVQKGVFSRGYKNSPELKY